MTGYLQRFRRVLSRENAEILALATGAITVFLLYVRVGHLAGPYFKIFSLLEFVGAFAFVILFPRFRYIALSFAVLALPRILSIALGRGSHSVLFPIFAGMSLALPFIAVGFRGAFASTTQAGAGSDSNSAPGDPRQRSSQGKRMAGLLFLFILFLALRALFENYAPSIMKDFTLKDRVVAPGVSANYAMYLTLLVAVNLLGPLLFIFSDLTTRAAPRNGEAKEHEISSSVIARDVLLGLALGATACLLVIVFQELGFKRLYAGAARSLEHLRPPGLFTDSGSAAVLLPVSVYCIYLRVVSRFSRADVPAMVLTVIILFAMAVHQGRGYLLALGGLGLGLFFFYLSSLKTASSGPSRRNVFRAFIIIASVAGVALAGLWLISFWVPAAKRLTGELSGMAASLMALEPGTAYARLDPVRAKLFQAGVGIFREHLLTGAGLNSFMVETAGLVRSGKLVADNPAMIFIGAASDVGILGMAVLVPFVVAFAMAQHSLGGATNHLAYRVHALPLFCLPTFFIGYHVIFAEFCAFILLPMLLWSRANSSLNSSPNAAAKSEPWRLPERITAILLLVYVLFWVFEYFRSYMGTGSTP